MSIIGAVSPAMTLFCGIFELYVTNSQELEFALTDVLGGILLLTLALTGIFLAVLLPLRGRAFDVALAVVAWLSLMCFLQGNFLNIGVSSLAADGMGMKVHPLWEVGNGILWVAVLTGLLLLVLLIKKSSIREWVRMGLTFAFVLVLGVQTVGMLTTTLTHDPFAPKDVKDRYILTEEHMFEVSSKDNILIFVVDSFDADYVSDVMQDDPTFFDGLDGFTYYSDNLSWYTRTFPAAASMLTGIKNDFSMDAADYFDHAYGTSPFLRDLKANNYKVNLYIDDYYAYRDAAPLLDVADNVSRVEDGYTVEDKGLLIMHMLGVATYRYMPIPLKRVFDLSTESFKGFVKYNGVDHPLYVSDDVELFQRLKSNGLTVQDEQNGYMFIHLEGCHTPYRMDENGNATGVATSTSTTKGCMKMIYAYMDELKRLGLYENATIVITGDHPGRFKDYENVPHPTLTALFFKPSGHSDMPLIYDDRPVSQDLLLPSLVASAQLEMSTPYMGTYWDDAQEKRDYYFLKNVGTADYHVVRYEVMGSGKDFSNWHIKEEIEIGFLYE